ncbi:MAG: hypothetical protein ABIT05_10065 [Chitinophagaceae bacterium]
MFNPAWRPDFKRLRLITYNIIGAILFSAFISRNAFIQKETSRIDPANMITGENPAAGKYRTFGFKDNLPGGALYASNNTVHQELAFKIGFRTLPAKNIIRVIQATGDLQRNLWKTR